MPINRVGGSLMPLSSSVPPTTRPTGFLLRGVALGATAAILAFTLLTARSPGDCPLRGGPGNDNRMQLVPAPDCPDWPLRGGTPQRNMVNLEDRRVPADWDVKTGKNIKWVAELGSKAYGGPIIADGKIFIGTNNDRPRNPRDTEPDPNNPAKKIGIDKGILMCFNAADGKFLWQAVHDKLVAGRVHDWPSEGIASSPVVEGKRLWYVSNRCELVCADTEGFLDGKNDGVQNEKYCDRSDADIVWKLDMIGELGVFPHNLAVCSPLVVGDLVFVVTSNGVDEGHIKIPAPRAPSFLAVHKKTGKVVWRDNSPTAALLEPDADLNTLRRTGRVVLHAQWSSPAYAVVNGEGQVIFPGGDGWLYAFHPTTGRLVWKFDANPKDAVYKLGGRGNRSDFVTLPVVHGNRLYIGLGQDPEHDLGVGHFWCIDLENATKARGDVSPELPGDRSGEKGRTNPKSAAVWHYGGMKKPLTEDDPRDYSFGRTLSSPAVVDGLVYIAEQEGILHCLDAKTGQEYWQHDMEAATWSSAYYVDGKVYLGNDKRKVLIFEHGKKKRLLAVHDMGSIVRMTPVATNGVLYIMTENRLYAIATKE